MLLLKENIFEDNIDRLWKNYKTTDLLRKAVEAAPFLGKWTLGGNHRQVSNMKFLIIYFFEIIMFCNYSSHE